MQNHYEASVKAMQPGNWKSALQDFSRGSIVVKNFRHLLQQVQTEGLDDQTLFQQHLTLVKESFQSGLTSRVQLSLTLDLISEENAYNIDAHDAESCKTYPMLAQELLARFDEVIQMLNNNPLRSDPSKSLLSNTTVFISSEFGRTMRQQGQSINNTGTDHNPYTGLCLLGGKGIRPGLILGETDCDTLMPNGEWGPLNAFHSPIDPLNLVVMGKEFDYSSGFSRLATTPKIQRSQVLNIDSVVNTLIQGGLGLGQPDLVKRMGRPLENAPLIAPLLA